MYRKIIYVSSKHKTSQLELITEKLKFLIRLTACIQERQRGLIKILSFPTIYPQTIELKKSVNLHCFRISSAIQELQFKCSRVCYQSFANRGATRGGAQTRVENRFEFPSNGNRNIVRIVVFFEWISGEGRYRRLKARNWLFHSVLHCDEPFGFGLPSFSCERWRTEEPQSNSSG